METLRRVNYPAAPFDAAVGCSPMVKVGKRLFIGGTSATNDRGDVEGGGDPYRQAQIIFEKINLFLKHSGAAPRDVVRVRFYVTDIAHSQDCLKAYSEWFKNIKPTVTLVEVAALARVDRLVEVEVEAFIGAYRTSRLTEQGRI